MKLKDLIGHTIIDISDNVKFLIKTDKGIYELEFLVYPDGTLDEVDVMDSHEYEWNKWNK